VAIGHVAQDADGAVGPMGDIESVFLSVHDAISMILVIVVFLRCFRHKFRLFPEQNQIKTPIHFFESCAFGWQLFQPRPFTIVVGGSALFFCKNVCPCAEMNIYLPRQHKYLENDNNFFILVVA
jgi:hypothetical protein